MAKILFWSIELQRTINGIAQAAADIIWIFILADEHSNTKQYIVYSTNNNEIIKCYLLEFIVSVQLKTYSIYRWIIA